MIYLRCYTVRDANHVDPFIELRRGGDDRSPFSFQLGESWWWTPATRITVNPQLIKESQDWSRIVRGSFRINRGAVELVREFAGDKSGRALVHVKILPLPSGGIRYTVRVKKGQKLAERKVVLVSPLGTRQPVQELLVSLAPGDYVLASRTGGPKQQPSYLEIRYDKENDQVHCVDATQAQA